MAEIFNGKAQFSGKPCGCADFEFCIVCADSIERRQLAADELKEMVATLNPGGNIVQLMSQDTYYTPEEIDRINVEGERLDENDQLALMAYDKVMECIRGLDLFPTFKNFPFVASEYEFMFGEGNLFEIGYEFRRGND